MAGRRPGDAVGGGNAEEFLSPQEALLAAVRRLGVLQLAGNGAYACSPCTKHALLASRAALHAAVHRHYFCFRLHSALIPPSNLPYTILLP